MPTATLLVAETTMRFAAATESTEMVPSYLCLEISPAGTATLQILQAHTSTLVFLASTVSAATLKGLKLVL
jgi:hypothetical protein